MPVAYYGPSDDEEQYAEKPMGRAARKTQLIKDMAEKNRVYKLKIAALESKLRALIEAVKKHLEVKQLIQGKTTTGYCCYDPSLSEALARSQAEEEI